MSLTILLIFVLGLIFLVVGASALVRGASQLAENLGISPLIIGLTIVALGTSTPELAVSVSSGMNGAAGIALGNVIGSNIFNILFILGLSAVITPMIVAQQVIRLDVPVMIVISLMTWLLSLNGKIGWIDGLILVVCMVIYTGILIYLSHRETTSVKAEYEGEFGHPRIQKPAHWLVNVGFFLVGLLLLIVGSGWFVKGAQAIARYAGVSEGIIGLTVVATGTSLPEAATSIMAAFRKERDIAVGNVIGSCIYNLLAVLGIAGIVSPGGIAIPSGMLHLDFPFFIAVAIACFPIFFTGSRISRWEGLLFLLYYIAYLLYLIINATQHDLLPMFSSVMLFFVVPITVITLIIITLRELKINSNERVHPSS